MKTYTFEIEADAFRLRDENGRVLVLVTRPGGHVTLDVDGAQVYYSAETVLRLFIQKNVLWVEVKRDGEDAHSLACCPDVNEQYSDAQPWVEAVNDLLFEIQDRQESHPTK